MRKGVAPALGLCLPALLRTALGAARVDGGEDGEEQEDGADELHGQLRAEPRRRKRAGSSQKQPGKRRVRQQQQQQGLLQRCERLQQTTATGAQGERRRQEL